MMTPMPAVPDETTKAFTYSTPAETPTPTSALPLDKWRDLSDKLHGTGPQKRQKKFVQVENSDYANQSTLFSKQQNQNSHQRQNSEIEPLGAWTTTSPAGGSWSTRSGGKGPRGERGRVPGERRSENCRYGAGNSACARVKNP